LLTLVQLPRTCHEPAMALRGRFQKGIFVAWHGNGIACVNQTRPHCVNQMGNTQSKALVERHGRETAGERHGMCESALKVQTQGPSKILRLSLTPVNLIC
jgi:hypothetical protein